MSHAHAHSLISHFPIRIPLSDILSDVTKGVHDCPDPVSKHNRPAISADYSRTLVTGLEIRRQCGLRSIWSAMGYINGITLALRPNIKLHQKSLTQYRSVIFPFQFCTRNFSKLHCAIDTCARVGFRTGLVCRTGYQIGYSTSVLSLPLFAHLKF